jgi:hypothetical protein
MSNNGGAENEVKIDDLIIAVRRGENGKIETLVNSADRAELEIALMRLGHQVFGVFNAMSYAQQKKSEIIKPKGSVIDFARRFKK